MKTWKLVSGIISIILSVFVVFQSMMAGLANALEESGQSSGSAGLIVSICIWSAWCLINAALAIISLRKGIRN